MSTNFEISAHFLDYYPIKDLLFLKYSNNF